MFDLSLLKAYPAGPVDEVIELGDDVLSFAARQGRILSSHGCALLSGRNQAGRTAHALINILLLDMRRFIRNTFL